MKKLIGIFFIAVAVVILSYGSGDSADVGVRITTKVPAHGHSNALDGGILKPGSIIAYRADTDQSLPANTETKLQFNGEIFDLLNTHSTTTNPENFTIPVGYNYAEMMCQLNLPSTVATALNWFYFTKNNDAGAFIGNHVRKDVLPTNTNDTIWRIQTPIVPISAGDVIDARVFNVEAALVLSALKNTTWCQLTLYR